MTQPRYSQNHEVTNLFLTLSRPSSIFTKIHSYHSLCLNIISQFHNTNTTSKINRRQNTTTTTYHPPPPPPLQSSPSPPLPTTTSITTHPSQAPHPTHPPSKKKQMPPSSLHRSLTHELQSLQARLTSNLAAQDHLKAAPASERGSKLSNLVGQERSVRKEVSSL